MQLIHYSEESLDEFYPCSYLKPFYCLKPNGMWFSVEGLEDDTTWKDWCDAEEFHPERLTHKHEVKLSDSANILVLDTVKKMFDFSEKYTVPHITNYVWELDWCAVMEEYQGIIIAPYHWCLRLERNFGWYYPWDCSSGCVWDLSVVESFEIMDG